MSVTVDALAAALREALPDCEIEDGDGPYVTVENFATTGLIRCKVVTDDPDLQHIEVEWIVDRADRDLARAVFDVIDRLEDRGDA